MLNERFRSLWSFLVTWYPDADLENDYIDDREVAAKFARSSKRQEVEAVLKDLRSLLQREELPLDEIRLAANRDFDTPAEFHAWLRTIQEVLESRS